MTKLANCPDCDSGDWEAIDTDFDDTFCWVIAKCLDCDTKFELKYEISEVRRLEEEA